MRKKELGYYQTVKCLRMLLSTEKYEETEETAFNG